MFRALILIISLSVVAVPVAAQSDSVRDRIVQELQDDGFTEIRISKTWLGRLRFEAFSDTARREIVVNPVTGVILRDYLQLLVAQGSSGQGGGTSGSGNEVGEDDDDDDDDDDEDDEDDEDRSGSNSGKG